MKGKEPIEEKLTWEEFNKRMSKIFDDIQKLIQDTNGTKAD